jgi:hypothetical protein
MRWSYADILVQPLRYSLELNASGIVPLLPQARAGKIRLLAIIYHERAPAEFAAAIAE